MDYGTAITFQGGEKCTSLPLPPKVTHYESLRYKKIEPNRNRDRIVFKSLKIL